MKAFRRTKTFTSRHCSAFASRKSTAFTLIELLVVIAIIAILAAILFPVFAQAREKARQTSCLSNMKQLTMGFMMYAQDYDESFPQWKWGWNNKGGSGDPVAGAAGINNATTLWMFAIFPYVKNQQVYVCPTDTRKMTVEQDGWFDMATVKGIPPGMPATVPISYGMNEIMTDSYPSLAVQGRPAETLVIGESYTHLTGSAGWGDPTILSPRIASPKGDACWKANGGTGNYWDTGMKVADAPAALDACARHSNGNNVGYADGHVKFRNTRKMTGDLLYNAN